ncbi:MAG: PqqD family protein [Candidatus Sericytochromatia bacterium]|nr:PqqD family protein [Candidatus Sericytochromatia bacterium]
MADHRSSEPTRHWVRLNPRIAARTIHGETLILTPHDSILHTLNEVGTRVWSLLAQAESPEAIAFTLSQEYEVEVEEAREDVFCLLRTLKEKGIIETSTSELGTQQPD